MVSAFEPLPLFFPVLTSVKVRVGLGLEVSKVRRHRPKQLRCQRRWVALSGSEGICATWGKKKIISILSLLLARAGVPRVLYASVFVALPIVHERCISPADPSFGICGRLARPRQGGHQFVLFSLYDSLVNRPTVAAQRPSKKKGEGDGERERSTLIFFVNSAEVLRKTQQ